VVVLRACVVGVALVFVVFQVRPVAGGAGQYEYGGASRRYREKKELLFGEGGLQWFSWFCKVYELV
jgi:hypothetical protein